MIRCVGHGTHRFRFWYYTQRARVEFWWKFNVINFFYFVKMAFRFLFGELLIITTEKRDTKGGYKCLALVISKRPLSESNRYEDI